MEEHQRHTEIAPLYDLHMHLGFFEDPLRAGRELEQRGIAALCATVAPSEFEQLQAVGVCDLPGILLGVGLHPWWIADGRCDKNDVQDAARLAAEQRFVAEIGLDFAGGRMSSHDAQVEAFDAILTACENGGHVLSIHAVQATAEVLALLDAHGTCTDNDVIFHWFSGSGTELTRAVEAGCFFSVNARMLGTRRGRSYAQQIPAKQLLLETDLPSSIENGATLSTEEYASRLAETARTLAQLRGNRIIAPIVETSRHLLLPS